MKKSKPPRPPKRIPKAEAPVDPTAEIIAHLAERITAALFTDGFGRRASRLVFTLDNNSAIVSGCGWAFGPAYVRVREQLSLARDSVRKAILTSPPFEDAPTPWLNTILEEIRALMPAAQRWKTGTDPHVPTGCAFDYLVTLELPIGTRVVGIRSFANNCRLLNDPVATSQREFRHFSGWLDIRRDKSNRSIARPVTGNVVAWAPLPLPSPEPEEKPS